MRVANPIAKIGEYLACKYLQKKGYRIIERNFRKGYGELDIVAIEKESLVFVEVKTRIGNLYGTPLESITPWKLRSITKTAVFYKTMNKNLPDSLRIDAVSVKLYHDKSLESIELVKNISQ